MNDTTYNGWANYETWVVNLWLDNDGFDGGEMAIECVQQAIDDDERDIRPSATYAMSKRLEEMVDEWQELAEHQPAGMFADLLNHAIGRVDWYEIAEHHIDEVTIYSAGWNAPGYMPDSAPALFVDAAAALDYVRDEMKQRAEALTDGIDPECLSDDTSHIPALIEALETGASLNADTNGEFGQTINGTHYFVSLV